MRRRDTAERPGLVRTARVDRKVDELVARARPGEIAVIDVVDLDRGTAERLVAAGVSAVVNAAPSTSGRFPVGGPRTLLEAGVLLVDDVGGEVFARVRDGDTVRLDGGAVYAAGERVVEGVLQSDESVARSTDVARDGLRTVVGGLVADAGRRLAEADTRILEGDGFPPLNVRWRDRVVVVLTSGATDAEVGTVHALVRRRRAVLVAVGPGADAARSAGLRPDLVVIGRSGVATRSLDRAREVLVLDGADLDVPVPTGIPRAHASSIGSAEDTAILLAHVRGAALVVTCGVDGSLGGILDRSVSAGSTPLITQLRGGGRQVSAVAIGSLRDGRPGRVRGGVVVAAVAVGSLVAGGLLVAGPLGSTSGGGSAGSSSSSGAAASGTAAQVADGRRFAAAVEPLLVGGRLAGHAVTVVVLPGAADPSALVTTLAGSGAAVSGPIVLEPSYLDPARARLQRDLAVQISSTVLRKRIKAQAAGTDASVQLDAVVADTLATRTGADVGAADPAVATMLSGLSRIGALTAPTAQVRTADLVVLVVPTNSDPATAARAAALAGAFARSGRAVVAVSAAGASGATSSGTIGALRSVPALKRLATVDDGDGPSGRVAAVLALDSILRGNPGGAYGVSSDASSPLPPADTGTAP